MSKNKSKSEPMPTENDAKLDKNIKQQVRDAVKRVWDERNKKNPTK